MMDHPVQLGVALFSGLLGFGGIIGPVAQIAQFAFVAALLFLVLSVLRDAKRRHEGARLQAWRPTRWTRYRN